MAIPSLTVSLSLSLFSIPHTVATVFVGVSRLQDNWHHPTDVMAGAALGLFLSYLFYRQTFHCFTSGRAGEAYAGGGGELVENGSGGGEGAALAGGAELGV